MRSPARFPARLKAGSRSQTVEQLSSVRPQFQSQPLSGERLNRFYRRYGARQDRRELRARVVQRNSLLATPLTSHLPSHSEQQPGFSFNFRLQH